MYQIAKHYRQGTVMTDPQYRNRGLICELMSVIQKEFEDSEGMLLYANDSALDFYPKFGSRRATEYEYRKKVVIPGSHSGFCIGRDGWMAEKILQEQDSTFFVKGDVFAEFEASALRMPLLARA